MNKLVTPRRGTHEGGECVELLCPDVGVFRCLSFVVERLYFVAVRDVASVGISKATLTMVDRHRIAWSVVVYQESRQMQFFAMTS